MLFCALGGCKGFSGDCMLQDLRWPAAWERGRSARLRARGPGSQWPLAAGRAILIRGLGAMGWRERGNAEVET